MTDSVLRSVPLFSGMTDEDVDALCQVSREVRLGPGETLFEEGSVGETAFVIHEGQVEVLKRSGGREVLLAVRQPGDVIGEMALLQTAPRSATVRARTPSSLVRIEKEQLDELMKTSLTATRAIFESVIDRWKETEAHLRQTEKMAQLGTMTAGVAHELNNPSAAVRRSADQLPDAVARAMQAQADLDRMSPSDSTWGALRAMEAQARLATNLLPDLDPLERSDREESLERWLEREGIADPWELAPLLIDAGLGTEEVLRLRESTGDESLPAALNWVASSIRAHALASEISEGASRVSEIVKALKSYAYLDQAPVQAVDVREGLDNTLLILKSKLRGITVRRDYDPELPQIEGHGSELNQVWTNLIDNAADALGGKGEIVLRAHSDGKGWIAVEVEDDGPGIPDEVQARIFDAFFTTKPPGKGTGLGLNISYSIVVFEHGGDLRVESTPGRTIFRVSLPVRFAH